MEAMVGAWAMVVQGGTETIGHQTPGTSERDMAGMVVIAA